MIITKGIAKSRNAFLQDDILSIDTEKQRELKIALDAIFTQSRRKDIFCIAIFGQNRALGALVLWYFITEGINFYLSNKEFVEKKDIPNFCDQVLSISEGNMGLNDLEKVIGLRKNPYFFLGITPITSNSGSIFLSSSGTTGAPKFIYFKREKLLLNAFNCIKRFQLDSTVKVLVPVPIGHMFGLGVGMIPSMLSGASIFFIMNNNIIKFTQALIGFDPDVILITPALAKMMVKLDKTLPKKIYISAGERIESSLHHQFELKYGTLANLYGSSELGAIATSSTPHSTHSNYGNCEELWPLGDVRVIVDGENEGQILCRHEFGFEYYLDKDCSIDSGRNQNFEWFRTNDFGKKMENGSFKVLGRLDNCINRSGFLISLEEIELSLQSLFPEINSVVVFEKRGKESHQDETLVAVCELKETSQLGIKEIKKICFQEMGRHMVPDEFFLVEQVEKLSSGKPDRKKVINTY